VSTEDWQAYFNERAAIAEFDDGLPRPEAMSTNVATTTFVVNGAQLIAALNAIAMMYTNSRSTRPSIFVIWRCSLSQL
jgi:hypothetical protein